MGEECLRSRMDKKLTTHFFFFLNHSRANAPNVSYDLTITDSRNKTTTVSYVHDTLSNPYGWMALLLDQETYSLRFESPWTNSSLQVTPGIHLMVDSIPQGFPSFLL